MWSAKLYRNVIKLSKRTLMSPAFQCSDAWNKRLETPLMKKVKLGDLYVELENKFASVGKISAIDVDVFMNAVDSDDYNDESEDLLVKLRQTTEASRMLPSTSHAFIRNTLAYGNRDDLVRVLDDRLNYGVFPDDYCYTLVMDRFVDEGDWKKAAMVASIRMLQEDFSNKLLNWLSLYSCHQYWLNPVPWKQVVEEEKPTGDDDEEIRVRVGYLRNPYFDDHFDLVDPESLTGKTFLLIGRELSNDVGRSYELLGACLYKKWDIVEKLLSNKESKYHLDAINLALKCLKDIEGIPDTIAKSLESLKDSDGVKKDNLLEFVKAQATKSAHQAEPEMISEQCKLYHEWNERRVDLLEKELKQLNRLARLEEIEKKKADLKAKEDELFFFDREDEMDLAMENKKVIYPKKYTGKKKKKRETSAEYVPPEILKKRPSEI